MTRARVTRRVEQLAGHHPRIRGSGDERDLLVFRSLRTMNREGEEAVVLGQAGRRHFESLARRQRPAPETKPRRPPPSSTTTPVSPLESRVAGSLRVTMIGRRRVRTPPARPDRALAQFVFDQAIEAMRAEGSMAMGAQDPADGGTATQADSEDSAPTTPRRGARGQTLERAGIRQGKQFGLRIPLVGQRTQRARRIAGDNRVGPAVRCRSPS